MSLQIRHDTGLQHNSPQNATANCMNFQFETIDFRDYLVFVSSLSVPGLRPVSGMWLIQSNDFFFFVKASWWALREPFICFKFCSFNCLGFVCLLSFFELTYPPLQNYSNRRYKHFTFSSLHEASMFTVPGKSLWSLALFSALVVTVTLAPLPTPSQSSAHLRPPFCSTSLETVFA